MKYIFLLLLFATSTLAVGQNSLLFNHKVKHVVDSADGSLTVSPYNGSGSYSIRWYNDTLGLIDTTTLISQLSEGIYYLDVWDNADTNDRIETYFWLGKYNTPTTITVQPNAKYGKDVTLRRVDINSAVANTNYDGNLNLYAMSGTSSGQPNIGRNLISFSYYGLQEAQIDSAIFTLQGRHYRNQPQSNTTIWNQVYVRRLNESFTWEESIVTWNNTSMNNSITSFSSDSNAVQFPSIATGSNDVGGYLEYTNSVDIKNLVYEHAHENYINNGYLFGLVAESVYRHQYFYSSDESVSSKHPKLKVTFTVPQVALYNMQNEPNASYVKLELGENNLNFVYNERYNDSDTLLDYKIYSWKREVVMDNSTNALSVVKGKNKYSLYIPNTLFCGSFYLLEITNERNQKQYLRFFTEEDSISCTN